MNYILATLMLLTTSILPLYSMDKLDKLSPNFRHVLIASETTAEKLDRVYWESFEVQKRDLRLIDYTDMLGDAWIQEQSRKNN
jgi:hypothetical protein